MTGYVIDASVAVKWCLPSNEPLVDEADALLASYAQGEVQFVVPDLFWPELANALWKSVWRGRTDASTAETAYAKVSDLNMPTIPSIDIVPSALEIAIRFGRTVYDSLYIALARQSKMELVTADERLANALAARFSIKWLGAL